MARRFALVIGNSRYDDSHLGRLKAPSVDVDALERVLKSPAIGQFDEVIALRNEGCAEVRKAVARFYDQRQRDDLLFLYFSGHGVKDEQGHLYLAVRDTELSLLAGTAVETAFISGRMDRSFSKRQVVVLDCCHSGAFARGSKGSELASVGTAEAFEGTGLGRVILTATDATQYAWEGDRVTGETQSSLFTHFLVDGLSTGAADQDGDGVITVDELYNYVRDQVVSATPLQRPLKWTYRQQGDIIIAQNPFATRSTLPAALVDAIADKSSGRRLDAVRDLDALLRGGDARQSTAAVAALHELSQDDSRSVASAAAAALKVHEEARGNRSEAAPAVGAAGDRGRNERPLAEHADDRPEIRPSDVFISYAHQDRDQAKALAEVLSEQGWNVWWDRKIAPGESFDTVIERELRSCRCAIVLWSKNSVDARWVRNEARRAARRRVLVPILINAVELPLEFENLQAADLTTWKAPGKHPELDIVLDRVRELAPIPVDRLARAAVEAAWRRFAAGDRQGAMARLAEFRPAHSAVTAALTELQAEAKRIDQAGREAALQEQVKRDEAEQQRALAEDERALRAVVAARQDSGSGKLREAIAQLAEFRPTHPVVTAALAELQAEAKRSEEAEKERIEKARREAARQEQKKKEKEAERQRALAAAEDERARRAEAKRIEDKKRSDKAEKERSEQQDRIEKAHCEAARQEQKKTEEEAERQRAFAAAEDERARRAEAMRIEEQKLVEEAETARTEENERTRVVVPPRSRAVYLAVAAGVVIVAAIGIWRAATPSPPLSAPDTATPRPPVVDSAPWRELDAFRNSAAVQVNAGQREEALASAVAGLKIDPKDAALTEIVSELLRLAETASDQAKRQSVDARRDLPPVAMLSRGLQEEAAAVSHRRAGNADASVRSYWSAAEAFTKATEEYRRLDDERARQAQQAPNGAPNAKAADAAKAAVEKAAADKAAAERAAADKAAADKAAADQAAADKALADKAAADKAVAAKAAADKAVAEKAAADRAAAAKAAADRAAAEKAAADRAAKAEAERLAKQQAEDRQRAAETQAAERAAEQMAAARRFFASVEGRWTQRSEESGANVRTITEQELTIAPDCSGVLKRTLLKQSKGYSGWKTDSRDAQTLTFRCSRPGEVTGDISGPLTLRGDSLVLGEMTFRRR